MRITGATNAQLAHTLNFDASYISRIRAGKRGLPPELPFVEPAANFFARNIHEDYQAEALAREMGIAGDWPASKEAAAQLIAHYLAGAEAPTCSDASQPTATQEAQANETPPSPAPGRTANAQLFFGSEGRREVALAFLDKVAAAKTPCELLLQSDEETSWMYEDPTFTDEWARRMAGLAAAGCTITVIHTVSRGGTEMWEGVREWLPLYLSGAIRPYYYPRLRDGIRMRSLFVARGRCALVSSTVTGIQGDALSVMLDDTEAVDALEREFDAYLALCRPLTEVTFPSSTGELDLAVTGFKEDGTITARIADAVVYANPGRNALVVSPGKHPVIYCVDEPRLVEAIAGYIERLPSGAADLAGIERVPK